jgi:hypothetical protein
MMMLILERSALSFLAMTNGKAARNSMNKSMENFQAQDARKTPFSPPKMGSSGPRMSGYPDAAMLMPMLGSMRIE